MASVNFSSTSNENSICRKVNASGVMKARISDPKKKGTEREGNNQYVVDSARIVTQVLLACASYLSLASSFLHSSVYLLHSMMQ